jgi:hypothetical protein
MELHRHPPGHLKTGSYFGTIPKERVQNNFPISYQHEAQASEFSVITRLRFVLVSGSYFERIPK